MAEIEIEDEQIYRAARLILAQENPGIAPTLLRVTYRQSDETFLVRVPGAALGIPVARMSAAYKSLPSVLPPAPDGEALHSDAIHVTMMSPHVLVINGVPVGFWSHEGRLCVKSQHSQTLDLGPLPMTEEST